jgi:hypothetical protein
MPPARRVVTRSPKRTVGLINCSWFQQKPIEHESRLEKHFVLRAMLFPGLATIHHQPFELPLTRTGRSYTPDFLLTFLDGRSLVVEVKRSEKIEALKERFDEITELLDARDLAFFVIHQGQIEGRKRASSACLIRRYATLACEEERVMPAVQFVQKKPNGVSILTLREKFGLSQPSVLHLISRRRIAVNPMLQLDAASLVFPTQKDLQNASLQFGKWFGCAPWRTPA